MGKQIKSVEGVIAALGGRRAVATMFDCNPKAIDHWVWNSVIPSHAYPGVVQALELRGASVGLDLFNWGHGAKVVNPRRRLAS
jgi:hypothetical protein